MANFRVTTVRARRVLVTGATGFFGGRTVDLLRSKNWEVIPTSGSGTRGTRPLNLLDAGAVRSLITETRPSHLLHAAWLPVHGNVMQSSENVRWLAASLSLVQTFKEYGGRRALVVGSSAEYDWNGGICRNGQTPTRPATLYGVCKCALRFTLQAYATTEGLDFVWPRVFFVYGPGEHHTRLVASVIRSLIRGEPAKCTDGSQVRDYIHVNDVSTGLVAALESNYNGSVDLASGNGIAVRDLVSQVAKYLGREDLLHLGALPAKDDYPVVLGDPHEAELLLGWKPQISIKDGLASTVEWGKRVFSNRHSGADERNG
jgi:nucleoside-diphosphate-sugar epimerase